MWRKKTRGFSIVPVKAPIKRTSERGFTLIETSIALVIMMVVGLGAASLFSYAVYNNSGGQDRALALALAQQTLETLRSARYTRTVTDARLAAGTTTQDVIRGGTRLPNNTWANARPYRLTTIITDVPSSTTLKVITVTVTPQGAGQGWATGAGGAVTLTTLRARSDQL